MILWLVGWWNTCWLVGGRLLVVVGSVVGCWWLVGQWSTCWLVSGGWVSIGPAGESVVGG